MFGWCRCGSSPPVSTLGQTPQSPNRCQGLSIKTRFYPRGGSQSYCGAPIGAGLQRYCPCSSAGSRKSHRGVRGSLSKHNFARGVVAKATAVRQPRISSVLVISRVSVITLRKPPPFPRSISQLVTSRRVTTLLPYSSAGRRKSQRGVSGRFYDWVWVLAPGFQVVSRRALPHTVSCSLKLSFRIQCLEYILMDLFDLVRARPFLPGPSPSTVCLHLLLLLLLLLLLCSPPPAAPPPSPSAARCRAPSAGSQWRPAHPSSWWLRC